MTKTQTTKTGSNNANITTWIDSLTTKRETWENGTYKESNEELYVLLDECVDLFKEVRAHRPLVKKLNLILEVCITIFSVKFCACAIMLSI